jgi:hypothetical protein
VGLGLVQEQHVLFNAAGGRIAALLIACVACHTVQFAPCTASREPR